MNKEGLDNNDSHLNMPDLHSREKYMHEALDKK